MFSLVVTGFYLCLPLVFGGILHMVAVKIKAFEFLNKPIHLRLFGANKTYRGLLVMPCATWLGMILTCRLEPSFGDFLTLRLSNLELHSLGLLLGLSYVLFELPNSFLKRRLGVPPGHVPKQNRWFFLLLDHTDSLLGVVFVYLLYFGEFRPEIWLVVLIGPILHFGVNAPLYFLGIRKNLL